MQPLDGLQFTAPLQITACASCSAELRRVIARVQEFVNLLGHLGWQEKLSGYVSIASLSR